MKKNRLECIKLEKFNTIGSKEMSVLRGGEGVICEGGGTEEDPYTLETYSCTPNGGAWDGCDDLDN